MIGSASKRVSGVLVALLTASVVVLAGGPAFAQGHGGGGGGHMGGGGGGHFGGGGGHTGGGGGMHMGGGVRMGGAPHFAGGARFGGAPHFAGAPRFTGGAQVGGGARFSAPVARAGFSGARVGYAPRPGAVAGHSYVGGGRGYVGAVGGRSGYYGRPGWRPGYGHYWGGGYWNGGFWPRAYYGWGFPLFLAALPIGYATYYWGGIPYYYTNDVYYTWNAGQSGYVVSDPPPVAGTGDDNSGADGSDTGGANGAAADVYAYPQNGQTDEQQSNDRYQCHTWARSQTGFDPTVSNSGGSSDDYRRAMVACMDARGYSAR